MILGGFFGSFRLERSKVPRSFEGLSVSRENGGSKVCLEIIRFQRPFEGLLFLTIHPSDERMLLNH